MELRLQKGRDYIKLVPSDENPGVFYFSVGQTEMVELSRAELRQLASMLHIMAYDREEE